MLLHNVNAYSKNMPSHSESTLLCSCSPWFTQRTSSPSWHCNTYNYNTRFFSIGNVCVQCICILHTQLCSQISVNFMYSNMWQEHIRMGNLIKDDLSTQVACSYVLLPHAEGKTRERQGSGNEVYRLICTLVVGTAK